MNDHPRIDPAAVVAGHESPPAPLTAADHPRPHREIVDAARNREGYEIGGCPTCGNVVAFQTLKTMTVDVGDCFGLLHPQQIQLMSQHCARDECKKFCATLLQLAGQRIEAVVKSAGQKPLKTEL